MPKDEKDKNGQGQGNGKPDKPEKTTAEKIKEDKHNFEKSFRKERVSAIPPPIPSGDATSQITSPIYFYVSGSVKVTADSKNVKIIYRNQ